MSDHNRDRRADNFPAIGRIYPGMQPSTTRPVPGRTVLGLVAGGLALGLLAGCSSGDGVTGSGTAIGPAATGSVEAPLDAGPTGTTPTTAPATTPAASRPATPAPPAATPAAGGRPVAVPATVMLRPTDWPGGRIRSSSTGVGELEQTEPSACQTRTAYPSDRYRVAARTVLVASDEPESGGVNQVVVRYAPGRAVQAMAEMRRVLAGCRGYRLPDAVSDRPTTRTYRLEAERFTGDDALLIKQSDRGEGEDREWGFSFSVVRLGDSLITTSSEIGEGVADSAVGRRLAIVGATRAACLRSTC